MGKPYIICVDDEPVVLRSLKEQLIPEFGIDFNIETADTSKEALELFIDLCTRNEEVPLIITDYIMPDMKGDEFLKHIYKINSKTVAVFLTGQATLEGIANAVNYGSLFKCISKPWSSDGLYSDIRLALDCYYSIRLCDQNNLSLMQDNNDLIKEIDENSKELEIGNKILMSEPDIARAGYFMEQILYKISNSISIMKTSINMISAHKEETVRGDSRSSFTCMKSVDDFYNALSLVADSIVETIDPDNVKYFMEPVNTNNTDKLFEKVSMIYKRFADAANQLVPGAGEADVNKEEPDSRNIDKIAAWDNEEMLVFHLSDVLYFTSEGGNTFVNTTSGAYKMRDTLDILENRLAARNFFRCHRSFLINLEHVTKITPWIGRNYILNLNGSSEEIPVSRNRLNEIKKLLGAF